MYIPRDRRRRGQTAHRFVPAAQRQFGTILLDTATGGEGCGACHLGAGLDANFYKFAWENLARARPHVREWSMFHVQRRTYRLPVPSCVVRGAQTTPAIFIIAVCKGIGLYGERVAVEKIVSDIKRSPLSAPRVCFV